MNGLLHVSSSPHARSKVTTDKIMFAVLLALAPAACVGVWNFGLRALLLIAISMAVCPLTEYLYEKGMKKPVTIAAEAFAPSAPTIAESMYCIAIVVICVRIAGRLNRPTC